MNWRMVEDWLQRDDRCVLPVGCTEHHAGPSLGIDCILAERVAVQETRELLDDGWECHAQL